MFKLDHISLVSKSKKDFEAFWVDFIGYKLLSSKKVSLEKMKTLFELETESFVYKYVHPTLPLLEAHILNEDFSDRCKARGPGHFCLYLDEPRVNFINRFPLLENRLKRYKDPEGWEIMFLLDFDGNWIELREPL